MLSCILFVFGALVGKYKTVKHIALRYCFTLNQHYYLMKLSVGNAIKVQACSIPSSIFDFRICFNPLAKTVRSYQTPEGWSCKGINILQ